MFASFCPSICVLARCSHNFAKIVVIINMISSTLLEPTKGLDGGGFYSHGDMKLTEHWRVLESVLPKTFILLQNLLFPGPDGGSLND